MAQYEQTLCWGCKNTDRHKCSWFNPADPQPVPGWVAEPRVKSVIGETYLVKECPNFEPEPPRVPVYCGPTIPGVRRHGSGWEALLYRNKKRYHLGSFPTYEAAAAARKAAEAAVARGEDPPEPPRRGPGRPSDCPGVYYRQGRWEARASRKGRVWHLGCFDTKEQAIAARKAAEEALKRGEEPSRKK